MKKLFTFFVASLLSMQMGTLLFAQSIIPEISEPDRTTQCTQFTMNLFRGNTDARTSGAVSDLQEALANKYNIDADILVTGFFGPKTQMYVKMFQRDNSIQQTGTVGPVTRAALNRLCDGVGGGVPCPMDVRQCSGGSYVSRVAPSCDFARCPGSGGGIYPACKPLPAGYQPNLTMVYMPCTCPNGSVQQTNDGYSNCANPVLPTCLPEVPGQMYTANNVQCRCLDGTEHSSNGGHTSACTNSPVACTQEAKMCPDGSYVGKTGPNCAFAACPGTTAVPNCIEPAPGQAIYDTYTPQGCKCPDGTVKTYTSVYTSCVGHTGGANQVTATLTASPTTVAQNGQTTLTWSSTNATSCKIRSSVTGDLGALPTASGSLTANGFTSTATMSISCVNASGVSAISSVVVTVR